MHMTLKISTAVGVGITIVVEMYWQFPRIILGWLLIAILLVLLLLLHVLYVFINQNRPGRIGFIIGAEIFTLVAKVQKRRPLIQCYAGVGLLCLDKGTKCFQSIRCNTIFQSHLNQGNYHFLIQGPVSTMKVEAKAKLYPELLLLCCEIQNDDWQRDDWWTRL
jgi:hypothetical protein